MGKINYLLFFSFFKTLRTERTIAGTQMKRVTPIIIKIMTVSFFAKIGIVCVNSVLFAFTQCHECVNNVINASKITIFIIFVV